MIRKKNSNQYDLAITYGFRKRFNGVLKMENSVNSNIAEKLMAHKRGLDGVYLQPTREECFKEFVKAIPQLTVNPTERQKAEFDNKLANIYPDIESLELRNTGVIKGLISGDRIKVERKNQHPYMMKNKAILFFSANKFPKVLDQSDAMFRRFFIIDWTRQFSGNSKDTQLKDILRNDSVEHSGILNILVRLARDLDSRGFYRHEQDIEELRDKWNKRADIIQQFYEDEVELDDEYFIEKGALFSDYVRYCTENKLQRESERQFRKIIKDITLLTDAFKRLDGKSARVWLGGTTRSRLRNGGQMSLDQ